MICRPTLTEVNGGMLQNFSLNAYSKDAALVDFAPASGMGGTSNRPAAVGKSTQPLLHLITPLEYLALFAELRQERMH